MNERDKELAIQGAALHGHTLKFTPEILAILGSFADLIRADEREACAKVCETTAPSQINGYECADAIRARGNT